MECDRCEREAVMYAAYSGAHLCDEHLRQSVDRRVRRRIRQDGLVPDAATPEDPVTWVIGLSGGKDSVVLTHILEGTFADDPRIELVALTVHEGIEGYRDESLDACEELVADRAIEHEMVTYAEEFDVEMDAVVEDDPLEMAACAYCGVFRRDILERYAADLGADLLLTGHNLDDEAQTALMNLFEGDVDQMGKHFEASLGRLADRSPQDAFIPRAKPLRDVPEFEVGLYAQLESLPMHMAECPHASEAFRGEVQSLLHDLEERHPGTRHSILSGYEELAQLASDRSATSSDDLEACQECGAPTTAERCRRCELLSAIEAA